MNSIEIKKEILCLLAEKGIDFNIINMDIEAELLKKLKAKNLNDPYNYPIYCWKCGKKFLYQPKGPYGGFYYCSCSKEENGKNITVSNNIKNCPQLFVWDRNESDV